MGVVKCLMVPVALSLEVFEIFFDEQSLHLTALSWLSSAIAMFCLSRAVSRSRGDSSMQVCALLVCCSIWLRCFALVAVGWLDAMVPWKVSWEGHSQREMSVIFQTNGRVSGKPICPDRCVLRRFISKTLVLDLFETCVWFQIVFLSEQHIPLSSFILYRMPGCNTRQA